MAHKEIKKIIDLGPDEQELVRLTIQHDIMKAGYGNLILAPLNLAQTDLRILDSATANGLWLNDVSPLLLPSSTMIGTDINPNLFPSEPLERIHYQVQDITKPWPKGWTNDFDLVHSRVGLAGCGPFPIELAVKNMVSLVKPGGWIQLDEMDLEEQEAQAGIGGELGSLIKSVFTSAGGDPLFVRKLRNWLLEVGLENVEQKLIRVPFGNTSPHPEIAKKGIESFAMSAEAVAFAAKS
jgi:hypothetical protein